MKIKRQQRILKIIFILSIVGVILSGYLINLYYSEDKRICDINEIFNCSKVSASDYPVLLDIPVAFFGFLGYFLLALISLGIHKRNFWKKKLGRNYLTKKIFSSGFLLLFSLLAAIFSLYLTFAEAFIIKAFCIFCLFSQVIIFGIAILGSWYSYLERK